MNCKLVGQFIQHLEVTLSPGEDFYAEKGSVIYLEAGIEKELSFNGSGLGRILGAKLAGESLFILRLYNVSNMPRKVVIGSRFGLLPVKINGDCRLQDLQVVWDYSYKRYKAIQLFYLTQKGHPSQKICNTERLLRLTKTTLLLC